MPTRLVSLFRPSSDVVYHVSDLVADERAIYWEDRTGAEDDTGVLWKLDESTLKAASLFSGFAGASQMVTDNDAIYSGAMGFRSTMPESTQVLGYRVSKTTGSDFQILLGPAFYVSSAMTLAVDDFDVYWGWNRDDIQIPPLSRQPKQGGPTTLLAQEPVDKVILDATSVYWMSRGALKKMCKNGTRRLTLVDAEVGDFTIAGSTVYWVHGGSPPRIFRLGKAGGTSVLVHTSDARWISSLQADGSCLYWNEAADSYSILRTPLE